MAYVPKKQRPDDEQNRPDRNPYDALTSGGTALSGAPLSSTPSLTGPGATTAGAMANANPGPDRMADSGPTATGYVNFDRLYNANAGVADREAKSRQASTASKAGAAQAGLAGAQGKFNAGLTGSANGGPSADDAAYATGQRQFDTDPTPMTPGGEARAKTEDEWRAGLEAGTKKSYAGPNALSGMDEYAKLTQDTAAAQDAAQNPLVGLGQTDAALLGAAGRPEFEAQRQQYGHLKDDLSKANVASETAAKTQRERDAEAQGNYARLLSDYDARKDVEAGQQKDADAVKKAAGDKVAADANARAKFNQYVHGGSEGDHWRNSLHDVADMLAPDAWIANAAGEQGVRERAENAINPMGSDNTSNVWHGWKDDDWDVWNAMTDADWAEFAGLGDDTKKRQWVEARKKKLRGGS
jgi:hypothetical protein